jgi:hypothetical protein
MREGFLAPGYPAVCRSYSRLAKAQESILWLPCSFTHNGLPQYRKPGDASRSNYIYIGRETHTLHPEFATNVDYQHSRLVEARSEYLTT